MKLKVVAILSPALLVAAHLSVHITVSNGMCARLKRDFLRYNEVEKIECGPLLFFGSYLGSNSNSVVENEFTQILKPTILERFFAIPIDVYLDSGFGYDVKPDFRILEDNSGNMVRVGPHPADS